MEIMSVIRRDETPYESSHYVATIWHSYKEKRFRADTLEGLYLVLAAAGIEAEPGSLEYAYRHRPEKEGSLLVRDPLHPGVRVKADYDD